MTIYTVPITGITGGVEVYGGIVAATAYVATLLGKPADKWRKLSANDKARTLVMATRYLDQQAWIGEAIGVVVGAVGEPEDPTLLAWPRSDVVLADGTEVDDTVVPPEVEQAAFELAVLIAADPSITGKPDTSSNIKTANAGGGVGVEYFAPTSEALGTATTMPAILMRLLGKYLASGTGTADLAMGGFGRGGNSHSEFARCHELDRMDPF